MKDRILKIILLMVIMTGILPGETGVVLAGSSAVVSVASWGELRDAVDNTPTDGTLRTIEITGDFGMDGSQIYIKENRNIVIQSASGGPVSIARGVTASSEYFFYCYGPSTASLTFKNIVLDGKSLMADSGAIYIYSGLVIMDSGSVIQNMLTEEGGNKAAGVSISASGKFIMKAGTEIRNSHNVKGVGGVLNTSNEGFVMEGGSITGCKGSASGGVNNNGPMTVSGLVKINGNSSGYSSFADVYNSEKIIIGAGGLDAGSQIGLRGGPRDITGTNSADYSSYFFSNEPSYSVKNSGAGVNQVVQLAVPDVTAPRLTAGAVTRTSGTEGTVKFTSNEAGVYYYKVVEDGAAAPTIDTSGAGIACTATEITITNPIALVAGAKDIYIKVKDGSGNESRVIMINIISENNKPTTAAVSISTNEDIEKNAMLDGSDIDGDVLTYTVVGSPTKGRVEFINVNTGEFKYIPDENINGLDSFTYKVNDGTLDSEIETVSITITAVDDKPLAKAVGISTNEDVAVSDVLDGEDPELSPVTYALVTMPSKGSVVLEDADTGAFKYTPTSNINGEDSFTYKVNDGHNDSEVGLVTVHISAVNDKPVSNNGSISVTVNSIGRSTLVGTDLEEAVITYSIEDQGTKGTVVITDANTGAYEYTPHIDALGADSFTFKVKDSGLGNEVEIRGMASGLESEIATTSVSIIPSGVADLASLAIDVGTLDPVFDKNTMGYVSEVENTISSFEVKCKIDNKDSTIKIDDEVVSINPEGFYIKSVGLDEGPNTINIEVTAQDGVTKKEYILSTKRKLSNDATLSGLSIDGLSISPAFDPVNLDYNAYTSYGTAEITIKPIAKVSGASITVKNKNSIAIKREDVVSDYKELLEVGSNEIIVTVTAGDGTTRKLYKLMVTRANKPSSSSSSSRDDEDDKPVVVKKKIENDDAKVIIDNVDITAGKIKSIIIEKQKQTTVVLDERKLEEKLIEEAKEQLAARQKNPEIPEKAPIVTVPITTEADIAIGELNGQTVKNMEFHKAVLQVETEDSTYTLPAAQINIEAVSAKIGKSVELKDIKVEVTISKPTENVKKIMNQIKKDKKFTIVAPAVEFSVTCSHEGESVVIDSFEAYVKRSIKIPEGVDHKKITTGVVVNADGSLRHVPTKIIEIDGVYYAEINSLTNSAYSVIWNPVVYDDLSGHWAKVDVNNMASRMINIDVNEKGFGPDLEITRAEFAALVVKGLGLKASEEHNAFTDVNKSSQYYAEIEVAYEYGLMEGIGNNLFGYERKITREEAMVVVTRAMKITKLSDKIEKMGSEEVLSKFSDSDQSSEWAKESIIACIEAKIVMGKGNGILAPKDNITRAEVMTVISRLLSKSELI